jgi:peptide/nickel transport system permease protein
MWRHLATTTSGTRCRSAGAVHPIKTRTHIAARRILQAIPIPFGVSLVVFGLVHIFPGNPIVMLMPPEASPAVIAQMKAAFGFDKPLYVQYVLWLSRALQGDFGLSVFNATPVWGQLVTALGFSLGVVCGLVSAVYHGRWPD